MENGKLFQKSDVTIAVVPVLCLQIYINKK